MTPDKVLVFMFGGNRSHNIIFICNCQFVACNEAQQIKSHRRDLFSVLSIFSHFLQSCISLHSKAGSFPPPPVSILQQTPTTGKLVVTPQIPRKFPLQWHTLSSTCPGVNSFAWLLSNSIASSQIEDSPRRLHLMDGYAISYAS